MKKIVVLGFVGTQLDAGKGSGRWERWRPTVSLTQHEDLIVDRLELFHTGNSQDLVAQLEADMVTVSPETRVNPVKLSIRDPWDFGDVYAALFDFARNYNFRPDEEEYWVHITTGTHVAQICLYLMTEARYFPGVLLQTSPPRRGQNVLGNYALIDLDLSRYNQISQRFAGERADALTFLKSGIATRNPAFNRLIEEIEKVAIRSRSPILLTGPTGAGKSFLARRVYELKKARHQIAGAFVDVNCATLKGDGAASALFGHVKGAFTGAASERPGLLRTANKGLLFLDEIGELGLDEQAMLLKAIEERKFLPVGSDREAESDFQLIAGTNRDLRQDVFSGRFREDLYARINLWTFELPGLAHRSEDIEPNIEYLLDQFGAENSTKVRFNTEARREYLKFASGPEAVWRGNFRDLSASVARMATLAHGGKIDMDTVSHEVARLRKQWMPLGEGSTRSDLHDLINERDLAEMDLFDRMQLESVIRVCRTSRSLSDAGRKLFSVSRASRASSNDADRLRKFLLRFNLDWSKVR